MGKMHKGYSLPSISDILDFAGLLGVMVVLEGMLMYMALTAH